MSADKVKIGVFGTWRGCAYIRALNTIEEAEIVAVCDKNPQRLEDARKLCSPETKCFSDFDAFIESGMDAVVLCNYFNEHAPYAIKAMERGIHVLSETTAASTMKECVELCRAVEKTGCIYALAENYPFMKGCLELKRVYETGTLGDVLYAEGEYVHPMSLSESDYYAPEKYHWRKYSPKTYYSTHSLAPLMYMTGAIPKKVIGKTVFAPQYTVERKRMSADAAGILLCEMDNHAIYRVTGSCSFAPHGNWYRLGCLHGGAELIRGNQDMVRVAYNSWSAPEGIEHLDKTYESQWNIDENDREKAALADKAGHGGGDFWVNYHFVQCVLGRETPFFDVYRSTAMSAAAILGWKSVLNNSAQYDIPDFHDEASRAVYEDDDLTPYPTEDKPATLPCSSNNWIAPNYDA